MTTWTEGKFKSLPLQQQHKKASELLRSLARDPNGAEQLAVYAKLCAWLEIPALEEHCIEHISNRFHYHLQKAGVSWQEHNLLKIRTADTESTAPFLPIAIYLDNLRSAFNVGSILRTVEAFRLGTVYFSTETPFINNPKVQKTSMGTYDKVVCEKVSSLEHLPRPFIALETADFAPSVSSFSFPSSFTLVLGNEEYGLSSSTLQLIDEFVQIPLVGSKNSLNVAAAFAIAAASIRK